jgi:transposase
MAGIKVMRGSKVETRGLSSYLALVQRVPQDHPLRAIRAIVDSSLAKMESHFNAMHPTTDRPSIPPKFLLWALLLQYFTASDRNGS